MEEILRKIESAILKATKYIINFAETDQKPTVSYKNDGTICLDLDVNSQEIIKEALSSLNIPIIGEEDENSHKNINSEDPYIIIDPIDGTASCRRYLRKIGGEIGFGPMAGLVIGGKVQNVCYSNIPTRTVYSAIKNSGAYSVPFQEKLPSINSRTVLAGGKMNLPLTESACLFLAGLKGELQAIEKMKRNLVIENYYRIGGFANDCSRVAVGYEQMQLQFSVKAWDFPATLLLVEAGYEVTVDPLKSCTIYDDWKIQAENPVFAGMFGVFEGSIKGLLRD